MLPFNPANFLEQYNKARALHSAGRLAEAKTLYTSLEKSAPNQFEIPFQLAGLAWQQGEHAVAVEHLRRAYDLKPGEPTVTKALADMLFARGDTDEALALHDELVAAAPKDAGLRIDKAFKQQRTGDFDAAEAELKTAMKLSPLRGEPYRMLARNRKLKKDDSLIAKMRKALKDPKLTPPAKVEIEFSMAKAMEDTGQHAKVFTIYVRRTRR